MSPPFKMIVETEIEKYRHDSFDFKEPETLIFIESFKKDAVFYDIGANIGIYSLYCAHLYPDARIYAFEPHNGNYQRLLQNIEINEFTNMFAHQVAFSNKDNIETFYIPDITIGSTGGQLGKPVDEHERRFVPVTEQKMNIVTMDIWNWIMQIMPNHIKIDVDGQEAKIIEGMPEILRREELQSVLIEVNNDRLYIEDIFFEAGFTKDNIFNKLENHSRVRRKREGIRAENVVFTRRQGKMEATIKFIGNESSGTVHDMNCPFVLKMWPINFIPFSTLCDALSQDYESCNYCLTEFSPPMVDRFEAYYEIKKKVKKEYEYCIICSAKRGIQKAHILPERFGNIETMPLCPSCHWNYDHGLLSEKEKK